MSDHVIDARGLLCPKPVLKCKEFIEENKNTESFKVLVDNQAAKENVCRFLKTSGFSTNVIQKGKEFEIEATRTDKKGFEQREEFKVVCQVDSRRGEDNILVFITTESIGHGDDKLGRKLMKNFLATLPEMGKSLWRIILVNGGVKLAVDGSPFVEDLRKLEEAGVSILVCGTCLDYFGLLNKKKVGETTNMLDVVTSLQLASKVIKI